MSGTEFAREKEKTAALMREKQQKGMLYISHRATRNVQWIGRY
jgi:hypothetical protein